MEAKTTPLSELKKQKERINLKFRTKFNYLENPEWLTFYSNKSYFKFRPPFSFFNIHFSWYNRIVRFI